VNINGKTVMRRRGFMEAILLQAFGLPIILTACDSGPRRLEYADLGSADRIDVVQHKKWTIDDKAKIAAAAAFFDRFHDRWMNSYGGGSAPTFIDFYRNGERFESFGVGNRFLTRRNWTRLVPEADVSRLLSELGVSLPPE